MSDRELLELAAKAAGFGAPGTGNTCWTESEYPAGSGRNGALWNYVGHGSTAELWNPLSDDGDALRLAVKLNMRLDILDFSGWSLAATRNVPFEVEWVEEHHAEGGAEVATRRAIVRAAAESVSAPKASREGA